MDEARLAAALEAIEARLARFEKLLEAVVDAAPFWLRSKLKGAMSNGETRRSDTAGDTTEQRRAS